MAEQLGVAQDLNVLENIVANELLPVLMKLSLANGSLPMVLPFFLELTFVIFNFPSFFAPLSY
jgi:hypothetical protein